MIDDTPRRAQGVDVSKWEESFDPRRAIKPIDFAFQRTSEGSIDVDARLFSIWEGVKEIPIRGAYHYQRSGFSWIMQAQLFTRLVRERDYHMLALDVQNIYNTFDDVFAGDCRRIIDYLRAQFPGTRVLLLTSPDIYDTFLHPTFKKLYGSDGINWLEECPLWVSQYWKDANEINPHMPQCRESSWVFWQYTCEGHPQEWGTRYRVDLDVFNGTPKQLTDWVYFLSSAPSSPAPSTAETPTQQLEPTPDHHTWVGDVRSPLIVRSAPRVDPETDTQVRAQEGETITGNLWFGPDYIWMRVNAGRHLGKWLPCRHVDGGRNVYIHLSLKQN